MTTLETLQALSDEELIEKVSVEVMGWNPQQSSDAWQAGKRPHTWFDPLTMRQTPIYKWNPLTEWNHTMEVVWKLRRTGVGIQLLLWEVNLDEEKLGWIKAWPKPNAEPILIKADDNPQRSICLAALISVS